LLKKFAHKVKQCFRIQTLVFICKGFSMKANFVLGLCWKIGVHSKVMVDLRGRVSMS